MALRRRQDPRLLRQRKRDEHPPRGGARRGTQERHHLRKRPRPATRPRGTLSQNVRAHGLRRSRYRGLARTHVQHVLTAMACNVARVAGWIDTAPSTLRRATHFHALCSATA
ncbi:transposase [Streptomyces sp. NPDC046939]|uniref:transposase n=1 Tax=Streptomyces sp. NPDC046939 TaxID=3155376 RepID=UPI0033E15E84